MTRHVRHFFLLCAFAVVSSITAPAAYTSAWRTLSEGYPSTAFVLATSSYDTVTADYAAYKDIASRALYDMGQFTAARSNDLALIEWVMTAGDADVSAYVAAAYAALRARRHEDALRFLQSALRQESESSDIFIAAGDLYAATHDSSRARRYYGRAAVTGDVAVYVSFQQAQLLGGDQKRAALAHITTNDTWFFPAHAAYLQMLLAAEEYEEGMAQLEALSVKHPDNLFVKSLQSVYAEALGDTATVARITTALRERAPEWSWDITLRSELWYSRRQFARAAALAEEARDMRGDDDDAVFLLARCYLQRGESAYARTLLDDLMTRNPYHRTAFNFLTALDYIDATFVSVTTTHFIVRMHPRDMRVIGDEVARLVESYWEEYTPRYGIEPEVPVRIEIMNRQGDFAARSLGVPTLGALGVCFGGYITMTSPLAHGSDSNWEQTLRHEFIHVLTLQASHKGIHRWLTEGFSVYEEDAPMPYRYPHVFGLFAHTGLVSFCTFDRVFTSPFIHGAYQLSADVVEYMVDTYGWDAVMDAVFAYTNAPFDATLPARALGVTTQEFDSAFLHYVEETLLPAMHAETNRLAELAAQVSATNDVPLHVAYADAHVNDFAAQVRAASLAKEAAREAEGDVQDDLRATALRLYRRAFHIYPYAAELYAAWVPALREMAAYEEADELSRIYVFVSPHESVSHAERARVLVALGDVEGARRAYEDARYFALDDEEFSDITAALAAAEDTIKETQ